MEARLQLLQQERRLERLHIGLPLVGAQLGVRHHDAVLLGVLVRKQLQQQAQRAAAVEQPRALDVHPRRLARLLCHVVQLYVVRLRPTAAPSALASCSDDPTQSAF